jgi:hypothetical protein
VVPNPFNSRLPGAFVRPRRGLVSCVMMRLSVRFLLAVAALSVSALVLTPGARAQNQAQSSSASPAASDQQAPQSTYIVIDPLAKVRYDNRYDLSLGLAYDHMKAGPTLLQGSNLGGLDLSGSYWLWKRWGAEATARAYVGTSGAGINPLSIDGPFVAQYFVTGGAEFLGPHNKHGDIIFHAMGGGVYGDFQRDLRGASPSVVDFYNDQFAPAAIVGGHIDLNRSEHWVFRMTPDAVMTHYGINYPPNIHRYDVNFAFSVGAEYKFSKRR